jgi:SP family general alpha glucoside:H+ symporter-like MFS transporter
MPDLQKLSAAARAATAAEQKMTFFGACRLYPKAIAWSILLSSTIIMEGYDTTLIYSFFTFPQFRKAYGEPVNPGAAGAQQTYQISPAWQSGLTIAATVGEIFGLLINGFLADRFGYHRIIVGAMVILCGAVFLAFFAVNIQMLLAAQLFCGKPLILRHILHASYVGRRYSMGSISDFIDDICCRGYASSFTGLSPK